MWLVASSFLFLIFAPCTTKAFLGLQVCPKASKSSRWSSISFELSASSQDESVDNDPVEKIFNFFFGKVEDSPQGLKRFDQNTFPGTI